MGRDGASEPEASGDPAEAEPGEPVPGDDAPDGFDRWRKESAIGGIGTGIARGLQAVFAPPADEVVIVAAVPGEPPDADSRVRVILDPDDPTKSIAVVPPTPTDPPSVLARRHPGTPGPHHLSPSWQTSTSCRESRVAPNER